MLPTPDLSHLSREDYVHVYEPAEDTFILLDALEQDIEELRLLCPSVCLEVGSGSGCVSAFLGSILGSSSRVCHNYEQCTFMTGKQNKVMLDPILASFTDPFSLRLFRAIDLLVFNPPYVPTGVFEADDGQIRGDIQGSWAGGSDGMQITARLFEQLDMLLSPKGRFYLVAVKQNDIQRIIHYLSERGLACQVVLQRRAGREHLFVLRITR